MARQFAQEVIPFFNGRGKWWPQCGQYVVIIKGMYDHARDSITAQQKTATGTSDSVPAAVLAKATGSNRPRI